MKALSILGTSSNAGKSWIATAFCAWLARQGVDVAPFKAQNMSNNAFVTLDGGEIGRAQAVQAQACGRVPTTAMNPVLLKPSGNSISQLILNGQPTGHIPAREYYQHIDRVWSVVQTALANWRDQCDVLILEGAGSPVELNLMHRDVVNVRPVLELAGRWLLVGDIERGGVFAQMVGTYHLLPPAAQACGLGMIVNKFRGDLGLFADADRYFSQCVPDLPYLGTLPYATDLQPESEDSLCREAEESAPTDPNAPILAWIRFPYLSNSQDVQPWRLDRGVQIRWVDRVADLDQARAIVLPGTKNTLHDLRWLQESGLATAILAAHARGVPIVGICGGYQMLGEWVADPTGEAGTAGTLSGLGLLPTRTQYQAQKTVRQVQACWAGDRWQAYEIHMGETFLQATNAEILPLLKLDDRPEGMQCGTVWGTYLHGLFESSIVRSALMNLAQVGGYQPSLATWRSVQSQLYDRMADQLEKYLNLEPIRRYLEL